MATEFARMRQLFATTADWAAADPIVLGAGEIGLELRTNGYVWGKVGDGVQTYSNLDYNIGVNAGCDLNTAQTVSGIKTFSESIFLENKTTPALAGYLGADDFTGVHTVYLDSQEVESTVVIRSRDDVGVANVLSLSAYGYLRWNSVVIADDTGLAGVTWGGFTSAAVLNRGSGFSVATPATGQYDLVFDMASDGDANQSLVATVNGVVAAGLIANVSMPTTTTASIYVFDSVTGLPVDAPVTFIRNFIPAV